MELMNWYRAERWLYLHRIPLVPQIIKASIRVVWGGVIPYQTEIGEGTKFAYQGLGVVLNKKAKIGKNCFIRQNVTVGNGDTVIGDNVDIGAGAIIIGSIQIGNNVMIGANAVVNKDIPDNCTAVGVPAKAINFH